jgi:CSLREA domain-containing protein
MMPQIRTERKDVTPDGRARTRVGSLLPALRAALILAAVMALAPSALAADYTVTKTADTNDGACDADCSLREAVRAANASPGADIINVPAGVYTLTLGPAGDEVAARGDLDINDSVSIIGTDTDPANTVIQTGASAFSGYDRVFDIGRPGNSVIAASFSNLTIRNGKANPGGGGGIRFDGLAGGVSSGSLAISNCVIDGNQAQSDGGGIRSVNGSLTIINSTVSGNKAVDGDGGGVYHSSSQPMTVTGSSFNNNTATGTTTDKNGKRIFGDGGGAFLGGNAAATSTFTDTTFSGNTASNPDTNDTNGTNIAQAPTISCPADIAANTAPGKSTASVDFDVAATGSPDPTVVCSVNGSAITPPHNFPAGTTAVQCTATNAIDTASCSFNVVVTDVGAPIINAPADIIVDADEGCAATGLTLGTPVTSDNVGVVSVTGVRSDGLALDAPYPGGTTTITWTAKDAANNTATDTQTVTVLDPAVPVITAPANISANTDAGSCTAALNPGTATAAQGCFNITIAGVRSDGLALDAPYTKGVTTITWTATNTAGRKATALQTLTVADNQAPAVTAPPNVTTTADPNSCTAAVNPGTATASDNCGPVNTPAGVRSDGQPLNAPYPGGTTTITWTATDSSNNTGTALQTVTVNDASPPTITGPTEVVATLPLNSPATSVAVTYPTFTVSDGCGAVTVTFSIPSGSSFPVGSTPVTATATDAAGNTATHNFVVRVLFNFAGFFSPVSNLPTVNQVNAGRAIPVKFSLSGNKGLDIFAPGYPSSAQYACSESAPEVDIDGQAPVASNSLSYDAGSDQYNFVWKTESSWAGKCRQLLVVLKDGTVYRANFKFK